MMKLSFSSNVEIDDYFQKKWSHMRFQGVRDFPAGPISVGHIFKPDYIKSLIFVILVDFNI